MRILLIISIAFCAILDSTCESKSKSVLVAELDTGVDSHHPALHKVITQGFDFVNGTNIINDAHGHGTHVAGLINTFSGHHASIMPLRYYSWSNSGDQSLSYSIQAIYFSVDHGARIINYSGGGRKWSQEEYEAIKYAQEKGVLIVAAAGNEGCDCDNPLNYFYPASHKLSNVISVMSTDEYGSPLNSSNWGKNSVDVAAIGKNVYSTLPRKRYGVMSGTSQATAVVTGIAAAILYERPDLSSEQIKNIIINSVDKKFSLKTKCSSGGVVNAVKALNYARVFTK